MTGQQHLFLELNKFKNALISTGNDLSSDEIKLEINI